MSFAEPKDSRELKQKHADSKKSLPNSLNLRIHRALSWLDRAELEIFDETDKNDPDAAFIFLWIGFNAIYADKKYVFERPLQRVPETTRYRKFFELITSMDCEDKIFYAIHHKYRFEITSILKNQYVFFPFWNNANNSEYDIDWRIQLSMQNRSNLAMIKHKKTVPILSELFSRLYVLRNQLIHGGSTHNSRVNRSQVHDGATILGWLMPIFIEIMIDNPSSDWGDPPYPVIASNVQ
jgi:hypothetical protein